MHPKLKTGRRISETRQPRERSACSKCGSVHVKKRIRTQDYLCEFCGWKGITIKKVIW
jgi:ribosomal protein L37AE/L43A